MQFDLKDLGRRNGNHRFEVVARGNTFERCKMFSPTILQHRIEGELIAASNVYGQF